jgi:hypothetical protein
MRTVLNYIRNHPHVNISFLIIQILACLPDIPAQNQKRKIPGSHFRPPGIPVSARRKTDYQDML